MSIAFLFCKDKHFVEKNTNFVRKYDKKIYFPGIVVCGYR